MALFLFTKAILEGRRKCTEKQYSKALTKAGERWMTAMLAPVIGPESMPTASSSGAP